MHRGFGCGYPLVRMGDLTIDRNGFSYDHLSYHSVIGSLAGFLTSEQRLGYIFYTFLGNNKWFGYYILGDSSLVG
jgi:hypothetical protein